MDSIGISLRVTENSYQFFDRFLDFTNECNDNNESYYVNKRRINIGKLLIDFANYDGISYMNVLKESALDKMDCSIDNQINGVKILRDELSKVYNDIVAEFLCLEIFRYLQDYNKCITVEEKNDLFSRDFEFRQDMAHIFKGTKYTGPGDSSLKQLVLSFSLESGIGFIYARKMLKLLTEEPKAENINLLLSQYTDLIDLQHIEYKIVLFKDQFTPVYSLGSTASMLIFEIYNILEKEININKCKNCGRYFIPNNRSDTLYCDEVSPQDPEKTCKEYAKYENYLRKTQTDETLKLYRQIYNRLANKAKRQKDENARLKVQTELKKFMDEARDWRAKIKIDEDKRSDYVKWLTETKNEQL